MVGKLRAEGTSTFRDKVPSTADLYSISAFRGKAPTQPTCTVHQPSVKRYRLSRHVQCTSLPRYATEISSRPRQSTFHHKPPAEATVQDPQSCSVRHKVDSNKNHSVIYSKMPQKLPAEGTSMSTVQRGKASQARQPNLLRQAIEAASSVRPPAFLDTLPEKASGVRYPTFPSKLP